MEGSNTNKVVDVTSSEWRPEVEEYREIFVSKLMNCISRNVTSSYPLDEIREVAVTMEEKTYSIATSKSDYLRKISLKLLSIDAGRGGSKCS